MTTEMKKVWFVDGQIIEQEISESDIYKQEPMAWKLVPIKPTDSMLKAMDECSKEGYDERLYAGHAASVYMAAVDAAPIPPAEQDPEFFTHNVEQAYDWSEWVCPDPKGYLMKCCDCGLVHEAEFGVVRYKSETEREDCDMVDDPNLQAVFRIRRNEQWSPKDTAYRPGGLAQPEQEPVALNGQRKLVQILAENWRVWPARKSVEQTSLGDVYCSEKGRDLMLGNHEIASDQDSAVVTKEMWSTMRQPLVLLQSHRSQTERKNNVVL